MERVRHALRVIYKRGDLLLNLLTDLLTFSENQFGQQLVIEKAPFRLSEIGTQIQALFESQAKERQIDLKVVYQGCNDTLGTKLGSDLMYGPSETGHVTEMTLMGDKNRILQVMMNLVSNGLKFTPENGSVEVRIRCVDLETGLESTNATDLLSRMMSPKLDLIAMSSSRMGLMAESAPAIHRVKSNVTSEISVIGQTEAQDFEILSSARRRSSISHIPTSAKQLIFEFEVEDTGPGIPEDIQQDIFKPFIQGDLALTKKYGVLV